MRASIYDIGEMMDTDLDESSVDRVICQRDHRSQELG